MWMFAALNTIADGVATITETNKELRFDATAQALGALVSFQITGNVPLGNKTSTVLSFSVFGSNAQYYAAIPNASVQVVDLTNYHAAATPTVDTLYWSAAQILQLGCSGAPADPQTQQVFYTYYLQQKPQQERVLSYDPAVTNASALDYAELLLVQSKLGSGAGDTARDPTDPYWTIYGSVYVQTGQHVNITTTDVNAGGSYRFVAYCQNMLYAFSIPSAQALFAVPARDENLVRVRTYWSGALTITQEKYVACALTIILNIDRSRVISTDTAYCDDYISLRNQQRVLPARLRAAQANLSSAPNASSALVSYFFYIQPQLVYNPLSSASQTQTLLSVLNNSNIIAMLLANYPGNQSLLPALLYVESVQRDSSSLPILRQASLVVLSESVVFNISISLNSGQLILGKFARQSKEQSRGGEGDGEGAENVSGCDTPPAL